MKSPKLPAAPPPLDKMAARKQVLEDQRAVDFEVWQVVLKATDGNVTRAGEATWPELDYDQARNKANKTTRRLGLVEYAAGLRKQSLGFERGRPPKTDRRK